jgi:hypothetical protein
MSRTFRLTGVPDTTGEPEEDPGQLSHTFRNVLISSCALLVAAMIVLAIMASRSTQNKPACSAASGQLTKIAAFFAQGQLGVVAELSARLLQGSGGHLCPDAHNDAASFWYEAKALPLVAAPRPLAGAPLPPPALHQTTLAWLAVARQADVLGVPAAYRLPARLVATMAYNEGQVELAATAFQLAWTQGAIGHTDLASVARYSQVLTAWGQILSLPAFPETRQQAIETLATANSIITAYGLADQRPCRALEHLGYPDCTRTTPDPSDPILAAAAR